MFDMRRLWLMVFGDLCLDVSTPMERLAMYECAIAQVFSMCSLSAMNYDGYLGNAGGPNNEMIRIRLYWYSFVHEGEQ